MKSIRYYTICSILLLMSLCLFTFTGCGPSSVPSVEKTEAKTFTITFDPNGGEVISGSLTQEVKEGENAVPPVVKNGNKILSWNGSYENIHSDNTVTAEWEKQIFDTADLAEYVQQRTVTITVRTLNGHTNAGSGFFIDDQGTIVTNFHVIDMAEEITIEYGNGASYPAELIVDFNNVYDLAVLKVDVTDQPYLEFADVEIRAGESVYAVGSALGVLEGSFTAGTVSSAKRSYGVIECIQTDTAISSGNSGGPLVNKYGEVVGINTVVYTKGQNLNLAIKISEMSHLTMDKNWKVTNFKEWYEQESNRSWSPRDDEGDYYYSLVNNYQTVTGAKCKYSYDENGDKVSGYRDMYYYYEYEYKPSEYDKYVEYIKTQGFEYESSKTYNGGTSYFYYNSKDNITLDLYQSKDFTKLYIYPTRGYAVE